MLTVFMCHSVTQVVELSNLFDLMFRKCFGNDCPIDGGLDHAAGRENGNVIARDIHTGIGQRPRRRDI